jgi:RNA polymerase sigma-70 factor (ECF subfamily)
VGRLRCGEPAALREAYERHRDAVLAIAAAVLGTTRADGAWDVCHDVFVALARAASGIAPDTNLRAYLARAAANRARDRLAKHAPATGSGDAMAAVAASSAGAADLLERDEASAKLWRALATLPAEQREVI